MRALCSIGDFEELERFSRQKKSPIGYEVRIDELSLYPKYLIVGVFSHLQKCAYNMGIEKKLLNISRSVQQKNDFYSTLRSSMYFVNV